MAVDSKVKGLAVVTLVAVVWMLVPGCGDDDAAESPGTTPVAGEVFTFVTDDLCQWISADEVAGYVAAEFEWDGTARMVAPQDDSAACEWELVGSDIWAVIAGDASSWEDFNRDPYDLSAIDVVEFDGDAVIAPGAAVVGHPAVGDGVIVHNAGFGQFAFGVSSEGEWLDLRVTDTEGAWWDAEYESRFLAVAESFLEELGWLSEP